MTLLLRLQLTGGTKAYLGVLVNSGVSLTVQINEIHAVLGENGAGKPHAGSMMGDGASALPGNPQEACALGLNMVFQHFCLFDTLTVTDNVWLGLRRSESLDTVQREGLVHLPNCQQGQS